MNSLPEHSLPEFLYQKNFDPHKRGNFISKNDHQLTYPGVINPNQQPAKLKTIREKINKGLINQSFQSESLERQAILEKNITLINAKISQYNEKWKKTQLGKLLSPMGVGIISKIPTDSLTSSIETTKDRLVKEALEKTPPTIASHQELGEKSEELGLKRQTLHPSSYGCASCMTTFGEWQKGTPHTMRPNLNLDASFHVATVAKREGGKILSEEDEISGGIVTGADGYGRGYDNGPLDRNIADVAARGSQFLGEQLMRESNPDELVGQLDAIVEKTNRAMVERNEGKNSGSANLAGVRLFGHQGEDSTRLVGVNIGNQVIMVTNRKTGETTQLHESSEEDSAAKCYLGGMGADKGYKPTEVKKIDRTLPFPPEDALVWIATDGAWQNFIKKENNFSEIDLKQLEEVTRGPQTARELTENLSNFVLKRAHEIRELLPKLDREATELFQKYREAYKTEEEKSLPEAQTLKERGNLIDKEIEWLKKALDDATITVLAPFEASPK